MFNSVNEALQALIPFAIDKSDPLWDAGLLFIEKQENQTYSVELTGFYYASEETKGNGNTTERERDIILSDVYKAVYDYLQEHYAEVNPNVQWDRFVLEVDTDGGYTAHYESEGDEVSPDAPAEPETITAAYLVENLRNCLTDNAPADFEWIWEVLERKKGPGENSIAGNFFYSLNADKSDPQPLEPGEYIFMYNVSERLFDEFLYEQTKNWKKIRLEFSKDGQAKYYILENA